MKPTVPLGTALADPALLGSALPGDSWSAWRTLMMAAMGEPLMDDERAIFTRLTGREREPLERIDEFAVVVGRRGGKSRAMATLIAYIATLCTHADTLVCGERGVALCIAPDQRQAQIVLDYAQAAIEASPILRQLILNRTVDTLELTNGITIAVRAASFRRLRGSTFVVVVADESAFWYSDDLSANADTDIINAVRPGLATTGGPLIMASSPYARQGVLWHAFQRNYGPNGDPRLLVAHGASRDLNPSLPQAVIDRAYERDPVDAEAEYGAQFRSDLAAFVDREAVMACVDVGTRERPPVPGIQYGCFVDPSGGSNDAMTAAIGHLECGGVVVDALREIRAPFDPETVVEEIAGLFRMYGLGVTNGDRYASQWVAQSFEKRGVTYRHSELSKSALYLNLLPRLNARTIRLLDVSRAINQIAHLERRTSRGARDSVDHPKGQHDDIANAIAGLAYVVGHPVKNSYPIVTNYDWVVMFDGNPKPEPRLRRAHEGDYNPYSTPCRLDPELLRPKHPCDPRSRDGFGLGQTWKD
jgi:hypothetical protein